MLLQGMFDHYLSPSVYSPQYRDGGLPYSRLFAKVHPSLDLPLNALYLTVALVVIFGCIFLGSSRYTIIRLLLTLF